MPTTASVTILSYIIWESGGEFSLINEDSAEQVEPTFVLLTESNSTAVFIAVPSLLYG